MTLGRYTRREIRRRPGRTVLTLAGIVIGVGAIVSISITLAATRQAYSTMFASVAGKVDLEIVAAGREPFVPVMRADVEKIEGVDSVVSLAQVDGLYFGRMGPEPVVLIGVDPQRDAAVRDYELATGRMIESNRDALLDDGFAASRGIQLNEDIRVSVGQRIAPLRVVGLLKRHGAAGYARGSTAYVPIATVQDLMAIGQNVTALQIKLEASATGDDVRRRISESLPAGFLVETPSARSVLVEQIIKPTELALAVLSVVSLVVGGFVIVNSFLMSLSERRRHLAILRCLGATRRQVMALLVAESLVLGLIGTALGIGLGIVASAGLNRIMATMLNVSVSASLFSWRPIVTGAVIGPLVAVLATIVPARKASRLAPLEGLFDARELRVERLGRAVGWIGFALIAATGLLVAMIIRGGLPMELVHRLLPAGMAAAVVGVAMVTPLVLAPLLRPCGKLVAKVFGVEGRLAVGWIKRHPARTGLTVGVLTVSLLVAVGFGSAVLDSAADVRHWAYTISTVDFFVRAHWPDPALMVAPTMSESVADELAALPDVNSVGRGAFRFVEIDGQQAILIASSMPQSAPLHMSVVAGDESSLRAAMLVGQIVLASGLAQKLGKRVGDTVSLATVDGLESVKIAAIIREYSAGGLAAQMEWKAARKRLGGHGVHFIFVNAKPGRLDQAETELRAFCHEHQLELNSQTAFRRLVDEAMTGVLGALWVLMALVFVVASLGIINTLSMNVIEQTRELGLLRAVALKRRELGRMVIAQSLAMGLVSIIPGVLGGIAFALVLNLSQYPITGQRVAFHLDPVLLTGCAVISLLIAVLAGLVPARRAATLSIIKSLQYE